MSNKKAKKTNYLEKIKDDIGRLFVELQANINTTEEAVVSLVKKISVDSFKNGIEVGKKKKAPVRRKQ